MEKDSLTHWGIKGMRWGVRRFQNKDGSLTPRGRKRYNDDSDDGENNSKGSDNRGGSASTSSKPKTVGEMSNDELRDAITNLQLQRQYKQLVSEMNPQKVSKSKEFISGFVDRALVPAIQEGGRQLLKDVITKQGKKMLGLDDDTAEATFEKLKKASLESNFKANIMRNNKFIKEETARLNEERKAEEAAKKAEADRVAAEKKVKEEAKKAEKEAKKYDYNLGTLKVDKNTPISNNVMDSFAEHKKTQEIVNKALDETLSSLDTVMGSTFVDRFR